MNFPAWAWRLRNTGRADRRDPADRIRRDVPHEQHGLLEIRQLMRYWPVGMIGLGLYLLFTRMKGDSNEPK